MLRTVPWGQHICNRRFQSAGNLTKYFPLSRRDNILRLRCCLSETKVTILKSCPPIEIGGYKYIVPNGTESLRNIINYNCLKAGANLADNFKFIFKKKPCKNISFCKAFSNCIYRLII
jgi:hypothetical protein